MHRYPPIIVRYTARLGFAIVNLACLHMAYGLRALGQKFILCLFDFRKGKERKGRLPPLCFPLCGAVSVQKQPVDFHLPAAFICSELFLAVCQHYALYDISYVLTQVAAVLKLVIQGRPCEYLRCLC